jgi:hypothetical protein
MMEDIKRNPVLIIGGIVLLMFVLMSSGCLTPGQAVDKGINETINITGSIIDGIKGWLSA